LLSYSLEPPNGVELQGEDVKAEGNEDAMDVEEPKPQPKTKTPQKKVLKSTADYLFRGTTMVITKVNFECVVRSLALVYASFRLSTAKHLILLGLTVKELLYETQTPTSRKS